MNDEEIKKLLQQHAHTAGANFTGMFMQQLLQQPAYVPLLSPKTVKIFKRFYIGLGGLTLILCAIVSLPPIKLAFFKTPFFDNHQLQNCLSFVVLFWLLYLCNHFIGGKYTATASQH